MASIDGQNTNAVYVYERQFEMHGNLQTFMSASIEHNAAVSWCEHHEED